MLFRVHKRRVPGSSPGGSILMRNMKKKGSTKMGDLIIYICLIGAGIVVAQCRNIGKEAEDADFK